MQERDRRAARQQNAKGFAGGDFWFNTSMLLLEEKTFGFAVLGRVGLKTASGTRLDNARFTDAPGYFFDVTFGKNLIKTENKQLRIAAVQGLYVWQLLGGGKKQNDAYLFGAEINYTNGFWHVNSSITGFIGYINNGDRPMVLRSQVGRKINDNWKIEFRFQQGVYNFGYSSGAVSATYSLNAKP
jgi:hypothetical protein